MSCPQDEVGFVVLAANIVKEVTCPNCWEKFRPDRIKYVSVHPLEYGDLRLGESARRRFLPTQFHPDGRAIDPHGGLCHQYACPRCHLPVPRALLETPTVFASVFGSPSSGKSYFLASMTHRLRHVMAQDFLTNFSDAEPEANAILQSYENKLFLENGSDDIVSIDKTGETGEWYQQVDFGTKTLAYPRPFFFQIKPVAGHPHETDSVGLSRTLCLYDNAGESFQAGADQPDNPVTQHLAQSGVLMFVYDPTQEQSFRQRLRGTTTDPQATHGHAGRQDILLAEVARRVKTYAGLTMTGVHSAPLLVLVSKFDAWMQFHGGQRLPPPIAVDSSRAWAHLQVDRITAASHDIRNILLQHAPGIVSTAESFVDPQRIRYIPISATGTAPTRMDDGRLGYKPCSLDPMWVEVPLLYSLTLLVPGLIATGP